MRRRRCEARRKGEEGKRIKRVAAPFQRPNEGGEGGGGALSHPADLSKGTCSGSLCKDNKCEYYIHKKAAAGEGARGEGGVEKGEG